MRVVLDADVLIGALDGSDPHHDRARRLFVGWHRQGTIRSISVVNLAEVLVAPSADRGRLRSAREAIAALGVEARRPTEAVGVDAARLRSAYPISLPDAYCLATARSIDASLASFDDEVLRAARLEGIPAARSVGRPSRS